ncbi:Uncharacterised protein [Pseudomonas aeruginosa]|nr:Uncharacterised protein [Pseudomonas aeruginosa]
METKQETPKAKPAIVPQSAASHIDRALAQPSTASTPSSQPTRLPDRLLERLWVKMTEMYGHRWTSSFGDNPNPDGAWATVLQGLTGQQLAHGLNMLTFMGSRFDWPPAAPTFRELCLSVQPESLGLPDHDTAFHQALACRYRHQVVKAAAEATGVFDLRTGEVIDDRLRKRFGFYYAEMVRRWANNIPLSQPVVHAIEHDTGKSLLDLAEDEAEQQLRRRMQAQGLDGLSGAQARELLLAKMRRKAPEVRRDS